MLRRTLIVMFSLVLIGPVATAAATGPPTFSLPEQASEVAPGVFFLGYAVEDGIQLQGYAYARYAADAEQPHGAKGKPEGSPGGGSGGGNGGGKGGNDKTDPESCFSYISNGSGWSSPEAYLFDGSNNTIGTVGLSGTDNAFDTWESATTGADIVGPGAAPPSGFTMEADTSSTDGKNEVYFAPIAEDSVLGFTIVWSTRSRGPFVGQIVEADMVIDDDEDWDWYVGADDGSIGAAGDQIDFWGVFIHEAGHWVGMGHTDTDIACEDQTMYPSVGFNDDSKQSLGVGDEAGIKGLYG